MSWLADAANGVCSMPRPTPGWARPRSPKRSSPTAPMQQVRHPPGKPADPAGPALPARLRRPACARVRRERRQTALVDAARAYFAENLERELRVDEVCEALGCYQAAVAGRRPSAPGCAARPWRNFPPCGIDYAAQLLARGAIPPARSPSPDGLPQRAPTAARNSSAGHRPHPSRPTAASSRGLPAQPPKQATKRQSTNRKPLLQKHRQKK